MLLLLSPFLCLARKMRKTRIKKEKANASLWRAAATASASAAAAAASAAAIAATAATAVTAAAASTERRFFASLFPFFPFQYGFDSNLFRFLRNRASFLSSNSSFSLNVRQTVSLSLPRFCLAVSLPARV